MPSINLLTSVRGLRSITNDSTITPTKERQRDLCVVLGLATAIFAMSRMPELFSMVVVTSDHQHLGGEYYQIARALADGRGYSDPFGEVTGSTAWMPPFYTFFLAALLLLLGKKSLVAAVVVALTHLSLTGVGFAIYRMAARTKARLHPLVSVGLYLIWLCSFYYWYFQLTHDVWILTSVTTLITFLVVRYGVTGRVHPVLWGLLGGVACGTSPVVAVAWGVLTVIGVLALRLRRRALVGSVLLALVLAAPWTIRNAVVFGHFIPTKSNYFFDAYQANYADDDGLIDPTTTLSHPYECTDVRFRYGRVKEAAFIAECRAKYLDAVRRAPGALLTKSARRGLAATLWYAPFLEVETGVSLALRRVVFATPFVGLLIAAAGRRRRLPLLLGAFYAAYLAPYVLTTMHIRYLLPLTPLCIMFAFWGLDTVFARLRESDPEQSPDETMSSREKKAQNPSRASNLSAPEPSR